MGKTVGAMAALFVLTVMIVGPVFLAVSNAQSHLSTSRCVVGDIGCDVVEHDAFPG
ncbi:hypothetical protein [Acuticoccus yangtzensis]|uniref:hypothetical protein n=1 Tax=Acuticoccus yangtzensis TaxID=1443441 RepID=UPI000AB3EABE|nr:hypothetical protein [Acuticoccus yangtzensis]